MPVVVTTVFALHATIDHYAKPKPVSGHPSLFDESKHPRGMPENAGEFAPAGNAVKGGGGAMDAKAPSREPSKQHSATTAAFEAAFSNPGSGGRSGHDPAHKAVADRFGIPPEVVANAVNTPVYEMRRRDNIVHPSNTAQPTTDHEQFPLHSVKIAAWQTDPHNAYLSFRRDLDPKQLVSSEPEDGIKKSSTYQNYVQWAKDGHVAPPADVGEADNGSGTILSSNRRRVLAAQDAGLKQIPTWFGPHNKETGNALKYGDIMRAVEEEKAKGAQSPKPAAPLWQPKMFDAEPTGQKTMFDAGIEKGHGKPKKPGASSQPSLVPSLLEQIEEALSKQSKANKPLPAQRDMFHRRGSVIRYSEPGSKWDESKHPRDAAGRFSESHAQAHAASGKAFRDWTAEHAVSGLMDAGYHKLDAQMMAFKAAQRVHRREKEEPLQSAVADAVRMLNQWHAKKQGEAPESAAAPEPTPEAALVEQFDAALQAPVAEPEKKRSLMDFFKPRPQAKAPPVLEDDPEPASPAPTEPADETRPEWFQGKLTHRGDEEPSQESTTDFSQDVDPDSIRFKGWNPATESWEDAPAPAVAKLPEATKPLSRLAQEPDGQLLGATQMSVGDLHADPKRFQYKFMGVDSSTGVTKELAGAKSFNPMLGGQLLVWRDPKDGKAYVINGHHRFDLAKRSNYTGPLSVYFIDAKTPEEARSMGALTNIAEGRGTVIDAAKYLRDSGKSLEDLESQGISVRGAMARDAIPLSKLSPRLFQKMSNELMTPTRGLAIAKHLGHDPDAQDELYGIIEKREAKLGKDIPDSHVNEMAREMEMTPKHVESADGGGDVLFGGDEFKRSLIAERGQLKAAVTASIVSHLNTFKAVSSNKRAGTLEAEGNQLDTEKNREKAKESARQLEDFNQQSNWRGNPIAEAINQAAERLANEPKRAKSIEAGLIKLVHGLLKGGKPGAADSAGTGAAAGDTGGPDGETTQSARGAGGDSPEQYRRSRGIPRDRLTKLFDSAFSRNFC